MSGVIPMVSSSPPPFDEDEGDEWDEDFGNFMGAGNDISDQAVSQDWAAFPDSGSNGMPAEISSGNQEKSNINPQENTPTKAMELKLDAESSCFITNSDSGLDLDNNQGTESASQRMKGSVPHVDSGLFSSECSPSDPIKNTETGNSLEKKSTLSSSACDSVKQSTSPLAVLNEDSDSDFSNFGSHPDSIPVVHSDKNSEIPVEDSVSSESETGIPKDSFPSDIVKSGDNNVDISTDDMDEWGDFGDFNENSSASTVVNNGDEESEKSKTTKNNTVVAENVESSSDISNLYQEEIMGEKNIKNSGEDSLSQKEASILKSGSTYVRDEAQGNTSENSNENKTYCVKSKTETDKNESDHFADFDSGSFDEGENEEEAQTKIPEKSLPVTISISGNERASDCKGVDDSDDMAEFDSSPNIDSSDSNKEDTSDVQIPEDTTKQREATVLNQKEEDFEDFADFDYTAPTNDDTRSYGEKNKSEDHVPNETTDQWETTVQSRREEDSDDFADFDYTAPSNDETEAIGEKNKSEDCVPKESMGQLETTVPSQKEEDFDDFADFDYTAGSNDESEVNKEDSKSDDQVTDQEKSLHTPEATSAQGETTVSCQEEDDFDDFGDFDSATLKDTEDGSDAGGQFAAFPETTNEDASGNWAAFQETTENTEVKDDWTGGAEGEWNNKDGNQWKDSGEEEWKEGGEEDDFGDFGDFDDEPSPRPCEKANEVSDKTVITCFQDSSSDNSPAEAVTPLDDYIQSNETDSHQKPPRVWESLTKQSSESPLKWSKSRSSKQLLSSLKIDTRNILIGHKKPSVPIYASNLTLLEPTKGPAKPTNPEPTLVDTNKEEPQKQDIPPVQFDWSSSGLVNPLQGHNTKTLDLDFLVVQETESGGRSGVFDSELMHGQKPNLQPLENILANMKVTTMKKSRQTDKLGTEAAKIIKSLPDLSFMQAKVLMFPIRHQAE